MDRHGEAASEAALAEQLDPFSFMVLRGRGDIYLNNRQFDEAIEMYRKTLELAPGNSFSLSLMGKAYADAPT